MTWRECCHEKEVYPDLNKVRAALWDFKGRKILDCEKINNVETVIHFGISLFELPPVRRKLIIKAKNMKCTELNFSYGEILDVTVSRNSIVFILKNGAYWFHFDELYELIEYLEFLNEKEVMVVYSIGWEEGGRKKILEMRKMLKEEGDE